MKSNIDQIVECLENGGVVLLPTDTVYGVAVKPTIESAVSKIYALKSRPVTLNLPVMVASKEYLTGLGLDVNATAKKLLNSSLVPGAVSLVLGFDSTKPRPDWLIGRDEIALRIPDDDQLLEVLRHTGPLLVTSANKHKSAGTPNNVPDIVSQLNGQPDLVIDGGIKQEIPSTIINCRFSPVVIERVGVIPAEQIFNVLENG